MHLRKKSKVKIIFLFLIFSFIVVVCTVFTIKNDYRFIVCDLINKSKQEVEIQKSNKLSESMKKFSISELKDNSKVTFDQSLMLINKNNTLKNNFQPQIITYKDTTVKMNKCVVNSYLSLSNKIKETYEDNLYISSAYRTKNEQKQLSLDNSNATKIGASEHQAGLALDVYIKYFAGKGFLKSDVGQYVNSNCWKYGFIIRYPFAKKHITGIGFEPWHIRYVGLPHSEIIYKNSLTLEEYLESLKIGCFYSINNYIISKQKISDKLLLPINFSSCTISEDNAGNYIITIKN